MIPGPLISEFTALWKPKCAEFMAYLRRTYDTAYLAKVTGLHVNGIRLNVAGKIAPGSLTLARLGTIEPERVADLMGPLIPPPEPGVDIAALKALSAATKAFIASLEAA